MPRDGPAAAQERGAPVEAAGWHANLALAFERREGRSVLASRRHDGPLVVQKSLHPEGEDVCHVIIVHPPAGIAGGDQLVIGIAAGAGAHALATTPGAGKWYRSGGSWAGQRVSIDAGPGSVVEWLPQETIVFDGALAAISWEASLAPDARVIAWDIVCLGRRGSGEGFERGRLRLESRMTRAGRLAWLERGRVEPGSRARDSAAGLAGASVFGTMVAAAPRIEDAWVAACREEAPSRGEGAITRLPGMLVARYRGDSGESARAYFTALWKRLRPPMLGREAIEPRIWKT